MYTIKCEDLTLFNRLDPELIVGSPQVKLEVNTAGSASFNIYHNHPYYDRLNFLKPIFEISDNVGVIFRGFMPGKAVDIYKGKAVSLHGLMAFFNDTVVAPFNFPEDFLDNAAYIEAYENGNVVEFFLNWLIENHNSQVQDFQKFKLGNVTVTDNTGNNYVTRSSEKIESTWSILKSRLFESNLGGYLCIRYEADGNYIDYLSKFPLTNTQSIEFGKNLRDLKDETDASKTYSAVIPIGAAIEGETETGEKYKQTTTLATVENGKVSEDVYKITLDNGLHALYSQSAVDSYGWKCAPIAETTWEDVGDVNNLLNKAISYLTGTARLLSETIEVNAVDLHYTDEQIQSFRIYRNVEVVSEPHGISETYGLTKLDIDLFNPQNTKITVGATTLGLTDSTSKNQSAIVERLEAAELKNQQHQDTILSMPEEILKQASQMIADSQAIIFAALSEYSKTSALESLRETLKSELELTPEKLDVAFSKHIETITKQGEDLQKVVDDLARHFIFGLNGLTIRSNEYGEKQVHIDHDMINFDRYGSEEPFGSWDGVDFHTGNIFIDVEEQARFGTFAWTPRREADGTVSLAFIMVGG